MTKIRLQITNIWINLSVICSINQSFRYIKYQISVSQSPKWCRNMFYFVHDSKPFSLLSQRSKETRKYSHLMHQINSVSLSENLGNQLNGLQPFNCCSSQQHVCIRYLPKNIIQFQKCHSGWTGILLREFSCICAGLQDPSSVSAKGENVTLICYYRMWHLCSVEVKQVDMALIVAHSFYDDHPI